MLSRSGSVLLFRMTEIDIVIIRVDMKFGGRLGVYFIAVLPVHSLSFVQAVLHPASSVHRSGPPPGRPLYRASHTGFYYCF